MDNIIFKYLDMELDGTEERKGKYFDIVIGYPGEEEGLIGIQKMGDEGIKLYVYNRLRDKIMTLFSMERFESVEVIGRYIENRYNLRVIYTIRFDLYY